MFKVNTIFAVACISLLSGCARGPEDPKPLPQPVIVDTQPRLTIFPLDSLIPPGGAFDLSWNSNNMDSCTASGSWSGPKAVNGTQLITVPQTEGRYDYVLSCRGPNGDRQETAKIRVGIAAPPVPPGSTTPTTPTGTLIGPEGGQAEARNLATLTIPADAFQVNRRVTVSPSGNPDDLVKAFNDTVRPLFGNVRMVEEQILIDIEGQQPTLPVQLTIKVPAGVAALAPTSLYDLRVFTRNFQIGTHTRRYPVEPTSNLYPLNSTTLSVELPPEAFTLNWNVNSGTFRAVVYLGLTETGRDPALGNRLLMSNARPGTCQGSSLQNPFSTVRPVTQAFGPALEPRTLDTRTYNRGSFYAAPAGTSVLALNRGIVEKVGDQFDTATQSGWGRYMVLRATDGSRILYGNLGPVLLGEGTSVAGGQIIATVGTDRGASTPGVQIEYVPNPLIFDSSAKADAAACLGEFQAGSYYMFDDPNLNNPELHRVYIDGLLIRTIETGPTNTLRLGRLRAGIHRFLFETPNPDDSDWFLKIVPSNGYPELGGFAVREADGIERVSYNFTTP